MAMMFLVLDWEPDPLPEPWGWLGHILLFPGFWLGQYSPEFIRDWEIHAMINALIWGVGAVGIWHACYAIRRRPRRRVAGMDQRGE